MIPRDCPYCLKQSYNLMVSHREWAHFDGPCQWEEYQFACMDCFLLSPSILLMEDVEPHAKEKPQVVQPESIKRKFFRIS